MAKDVVKDMFRGMPWYLYVVLLISVGLMIASFIVPPLGAIHPSVLKGFAEIIGGTWLLYTTCNIPEFIERGAKIKASYGDASIEIGRNKKEKKESDELFEQQKPDQGLHLGDDDQG